MRKVRTLELIDDNGNVIPNNITKSPNDAVKRGNDVIEVVRCKDCKHWHNNTQFCSIWSFHFQNVAQRTLSHDYCSRGERREESEVEK